MITGFTYLSIIAAVVTILIAANCFQKKQPTGRTLGMVCVYCTAVILFYLFSILLSENYRAMSLFSSLYFISVDWMAICLVRFVMAFADLQELTWIRRLKIAAYLYGTFDSVVLLINGFGAEIALTYTRKHVSLLLYAYVKFPLYWGHLIFTYALVATALILLVIGMMRIPADYRRQYGITITGILAVVAINAGFLFLPTNHMLALLDFSLLFYSVMTIFLYWICFSFPRNGMMSAYQKIIFQGISQGMILFDYAGRLLLHSPLADELLPDMAFPEGQKTENFLAELRSRYDTTLRNQADSFRIYQHMGKADAAHGDILKTIFCEYSQLKNKKGEVIGQLFVLSEAENTIDQLTGFRRLRPYLRELSAIEDSPGHRRTVVLCDLNNLQKINAVFSRRGGDQAVTILAGLMRKYFPENTIFLRGKEAYLMAVVEGDAGDQLLPVLEKIRETIRNNRSYDWKLDMQYAISLSTGNADALQEAIAEVERSLRTKKMLDETSAHSGVLSSLTRALQESDRDTEAHVRRTQILGKALGERIGLSDEQQSQLSMLCILHDIGKIGIPVEILNKPGKLTKGEWELLQTHAFKGYEIARSTGGLADIAEMILHHHERWDGKGYPDGLRKESIPLLSRIISVIDAYDAMVNNRAYRPAISEEVAQNELRQYAGTQFDPGLVSEFLVLLEERPELRGAKNSAGIVVPNMQLPDDERSAGVVYAEGYSRITEVKFSAYTADYKNRIISVDENFEELTGYTREDVEQREFYQYMLIPEEQREEYMQQVIASMKDGCMVFIEHDIRQKNGNILRVLCLGRRYFDSAAGEERIQIVITDPQNTQALNDMAELLHVQTEKRLESWEKKFRSDPLTGLLNHESYQSDINEQLLKGEKRLLFLMFDMDKFKEYNDTYGHRAGDECLIFLANSIVRNLRENDLACRMGGDEFSATLFFPTETADAVMQGRAEKLVDRLNYLLGTQQGSCTLSAGAVIQDETIHSFNQLYDAADKVLYKAKDKGRGRVVFYAEEGEA